MGVEQREVGEGQLPATVAEPEPRSVALIAQRFTLRDLTNVAKAVATSRMFPGVDTETKAFTLMLLADSMGLHPMTALRQFDILPNGKPAMKSEALLAQHVAAGGTFKVLERSDKRAAGQFGFKRNHVDVEFTEEDAQAAGLSGKDNYKHYMADMLFWRMVARGVRSSGSGVGVGIITVEEAAGMPPQSAEVKKLDVDTPGRKAFGKGAIQPATAAELPKEDSLDDIPYTPADAPQPLDPNRPVKMTSVCESAFWRQADKACKTHPKAIAAVQEAIDGLRQDEKLPADCHGWQDVTDEQTETVLLQLNKKGAK